MNRLRPATTAAKTTGAKAADIARSHIDTTQRGLDSGLEIAAEAKGGGSGSDAEEETRTEAEVAQAVAA